MVFIHLVVWFRLLDPVSFIARHNIFYLSDQVPTEFIRKIVILLNKGSIHSSMTLSDDCSGSIGLREDFAKNCFETLLEFSLLDTDAPEQDSTITNRLAITSLLQRFKEVIQRNLSIPGSITFQVGLVESLDLFACT